MKRVGGGKKGEKRKTHTSLLGAISLGFDAVEYGGVRPRLLPYGDDCPDTGVGLSSGLCVWMGCGGTATEGAAGAGAGAEDSCTGAGVGVDV